MNYCQHTKICEAVLKKKFMVNKYLCQEEKGRHPVNDLSFQLKKLEKKKIKLKEN